MIMIIMTIMAKARMEESELSLKPEARYFLQAQNVVLIRSEESERPAECLLRPIVVMITFT